MTKLETINAEDLQNRTYEPTHFLVDELIPEGLHILAGAPKIGKSWLALWLCLGCILPTPTAPGQRVFSRCAAPFFLEIRQYSCEKTSCSAQKNPRCRSH